MSSSASLPHNEEAEGAVVGGVLHAGMGGRAVLDRLRPILEPTDFYHPALRAVYEAALEVDPVDVLTVHEHMHAAGTIGKIRSQGGAEFLAELTGKVGTVENITHHAAMVRRNSLRRREILLRSMGLDRARSGLDTAEQDRELAEVHRALAALDNAAPSFFDPEAFERRALAELARPVPPKLPLDFGPLDEALDGGFPSGALFILGAPPKHHKTAFLIDKAMGWAERGIRVVYITTELTAKEGYARLSARAQFGRSNKWHSRIKHEYHHAAENYEAIRHLAGLVEVVSLLDEEAKPQGWRWGRLLAALRAEAGRGEPMVIIADYIEEIAMRIPADRGATETERNKAALVQLRDLAVQTQSRVLAVCSVARGAYGAADAVFNKADALPEEFRAVVKHTGFGEYAASAILALQLPQNQAEADINDPETGHRCLPMKLHLAVTREGRGPVTVPVLSFAGSCRFAMDMRTSEARIDPHEGPILRFLADPTHREGVSSTKIVKAIGGNKRAGLACLQQMAQRGLIWAASPPPPKGKPQFYRHLEYAPKDEGRAQQELLAADDRGLD